MTWVRARLRDGSVLIFVGFAALCCAPLVLLLIHASHTHTTFTGTGATLDLADEFRYLAWIRDASSHGLIGGIPGPSAPGHAYFNPVFAISGLLVLAGISIQLAYQLWLPIAIVALFAGYRAIVWRTLPPGGARPAALALALMGSSPLIPLFDYGGVTNRDQNAQMITWATHMPAYWQAWGYFPVALALALMPVYVLGTRDAIAATSGRTARPATATVLRLALSGLAISLLSPQAGLVLAIFTAIFLARRPRALAPGLAGLLAPLAYYLALSLVSSDWSLGALRPSLDPGPWWTFLVAFGPALLAAAYAVPDRRDPTHAVLWCWLAASALAVLLLGADARAAALEGVSVPLAILAVKGWQRQRIPAFVSAAALALAILPGAGYAGATYHDYVNANYGPFTATRGELDALRALPAGLVLATPYISPLVPIFGGPARTSPPVLATLKLTGSETPDELFDGGLSATRTRAIVTASGARAVLSDCLPGRAPLNPWLAPLGYTEHRYGCAAVYVRP